MINRTMKLSELRRLVEKGEGLSLELKRSTGELREALQTVCAFLNGKGGVVLIGVSPKGEIPGQDVSDKTRREIAQAMDGFEPPVRLEPSYIKLKSNRMVIVFRVAGLSETVPFTYERIPYERVGSTTRKMPQKRYEQLLLQRAHSKRRWENQEAEGITLRDLNREQIHDVVSSARNAGRLVGPVGADARRILDRLGLRQNGKLLQAALVLFGKKFLPDYPQCELRMARFRGTDKTEFLDQKQIRGSAFTLLEEAMLFCQRHFPLPGRVVPERMERVDHPLIPPDALREILVNALIHRDYSIAGGAVSLAIFDDRVEIWSAGRFPEGITPDALLHDHDSIPRNPFIADVFYRAGLIEKWGRGTNRVISMCKKWKIKPPSFREAAGSVAVTFRVPVGLTPQVTAQVTEQVTAQVTEQVAKILKSARAPRTREELQKAAGISHREHFRAAYLLPLLSAGWLTMTIPSKPTSRMQRYQTTPAGRKAIEKR